MNAHMIISIVFFLNSTLAAASVSVDQDKILAIVYHPECDSIILKSDIRPGLDGAPRSLQDVVLERLMLLDGQMLKIVVTQTEIDRHLNQVQNMHKLTRADLENVFKQMGLTWQDGRNMLETTLIIQRVIDFRVKTRAYVDKQELQKFYDEHPQFINETYTVSQAVVPFNGVLPALKKATVNQAIESGEIEKQVSWSEPVVLQVEDIAADKAFIRDVNPGSVVILNQTDEGLVVLKMIAKQPRALVPLKDREMEIRNALGAEKFGKMFDEYKAKLLKEARVKYIDTVIKA